MSDLPNPLPSQVDPTLYSGGAGIVLTLLEAHRRLVVRGDLAGPTGRHDRRTDMIAP
ncbi:hypothetical protein ACPPVT_13115 [Angustibacter sp. McL0619]|uniref:hypothetical protein n=1 Tax=Angustibacter sp. McL0619 TaxID=3415676 RepID=UPI003CF20CA3